jgi:NAD(P)H-dependent FMN reductase
MSKILAFSGSTRRDSCNRKLLAAAVAATREAGGDVTLIDLADYPLPIYNGDLEAQDGLPDNAQKLKTLFISHQALLIASPEYNSSISPVLKNTIDWISREWQGESGLVPYQNKTALILAASPGNLGGMRMLPHLRQILTALGVIVTPKQVSVAHADDAFDAAGALIDDGWMQMAIADFLRLDAMLHPAA